MRPTSSENFKKALSCLVEPERDKSGLVVFVYMLDSEASTIEEIAQ